jgi:hypothetical protein
MIALVAKSPGRFLYDEPFFAQYVSMFQAVDPTAARVDAIRERILADNFGSDLGHVVEKGVNRLLGSRLLGSRCADDLGCWRNGAV